jgi:hypothetical protein
MRYIPIVPINMFELDKNRDDLKTLRNEHGATHCLILNNMQLYFNENKALVAYDLPVTFEIKK